jgi:DNA-binding CsgD family transcriptional regulator
VPGAGGDLLLLSLEAFGDHEASRAAVPRLDRLRPHLARGAMLSAQMRLEQARAAVAALDLIGAGAAMIAPSGKIRAANTRFEAMAFATTGASDRIRLLERATDQRVHQALAQINAGGNGVSIPMRTATQTIALHVLPVRGVAHDLFTDCAAILVAAATGVAASADESLIRYLYDLTPAEARIAAAIGRGDKVDRIALDNGIAIGTVRNHLKSVFLKSGVSSQTELALLLADFGRPLSLTRA